MHVKDQMNTASMSTSFIDIDYLDHIGRNSCISAEFDIQYDTLIHLMTTDIPVFDESSREIYSESNGTEWLTRKCLHFRNYCLFPIDDCSHMKSYLGAVLISI